MADTLEILERLIGFPSVSAVSNLDIIDFIGDFLHEHGFEVRRVPDATGQKAGIFASLGPAGAGIMLSGHTDVVPVEGQEWQRDPFRLTREGDRYFGRGTTDMKGFVASALALAGRAARVPLNEPLKLALSYDEEVGCGGIRQMIGDLEGSIGLPRACIVGEPTQMQVAVGHKGKAALRAVCHGEAGHSALAPRFVNAAHLAAAFVAELQVLQAELARTGARDESYDIPYSTVHVGRLSGGTALNIVPDRAEVIFEYRHLADDRPDDLRQRIEQAAARAAVPFRQDHPGARIEIEETNAYPGLDVAETGDVVMMVQGMAGVTGTTKVAFGTEAGFFDGLGIPTVVCGPGSMEGQGHKPDEYISGAQLAACDEMMDRVLRALTA